MYYRGMKTTLTDGSPVTDDHREIDPNTGLQKGYVVLSEEERAKGFVEPVRNSYTHIGRKICGHDFGAYEGGVLGEHLVCGDVPGHDADHGSHRMLADSKKMARLESLGYFGGCGATTTMGRSLAETYAAKPTFYSGTYCTMCGTHFSVGEGGEFVWSGTLIRVGSRSTKD